MGNKILLILAVLVLFSASNTLLAQSGILYLGVTGTEEYSQDKKVIKQDLKLNADKKKKEFSFGINAYMWLTSLNGEAAVPNDNPLLPPQTPVTDVSMSLSETIENLKIAAMLAGSLRYRDFGLLFDVSYSKMKFDGEVPLQSGFIYSSLTSKSFTGDFDIAYRIPLKNKNIALDCYAGIRLINQDNTLDLTYANTQLLSKNSTKTWVDPVIGAASEFQLGKNWFLYFKGDVGGFGISSKFTWLLAGLGGYRFADHWQASVGFKALGVNYDKDYYLWNATTYGTLLSFGYRL